MRAILTGVVAAIEAVAVALASLLVVAAYAFLVWWLSFGLAAEPSVVFGGAGAAWLLAHFSPLSVAISAETMQVLGFAPEALTFGISLAPLGVTLATVLFAVRAGWRFAARGAAGSAGVLGGALGFGAIGLIVHLVMPNHVAVTVDSGAMLAAGACALVYGASSGAAYVIRSARDQQSWWVALVAQIEGWIAKLGFRRPAAFPYRVGQVLRLSAMLVAGYIGLAAIAMTLTIIVRFAHVIGASEALQLDIWGTMLMFVLQLALLPVLVIWSGAWMTGAGFSVGMGASASPFGQLLGPMPGIPLLAAIPDGWGSVAVLAPLLLALVGVGIGVALGDIARRQSVAQLAMQSVAAGALAGLGVALLNVVASGSLGPGRLSETGPEVWTVAGLAAALLGVGSFFGALAARADLARRFAAAPSGVAARLGLGSDDVAPEAMAHAEAMVPAATIASTGAAARDETAARDESVARGDVEPGLAPVARLVPREQGQPLNGDDLETDKIDDFDVASYGATGFAAGSGEQLTEPLDGLDELADAPRLEPAPEPLAPEAELFDQLDADTGEVIMQGDASDRGLQAPRASSSGAAAQADAVADKQREFEEHADALIEAYSWENADLGGVERLGDAHENGAGAGKAAGLLGRRPTGDDAAQGGPRNPLGGAVKRERWRWPGRKG